MTPYRTYALDDKEALRTSFGAHCRACHTKTQHYMHPLEHGNIYDCLGEGGGAPYNGTTRFIVRNKCTNCGHISYDLAEQTGRVNSNRQWIRFCLTSGHGCGIITA